MAKTPVCLVCQKNMEPGFIADRTDSGPVLQRWCEGTPQEPPTWFGVPAGELPDRQARAGLRVYAYRCPECEALRLYAPSVH